MSSPVIWSGNFAKFLKDKLNLSDTAYILTGSANPSSSATDAPRSSIYLRNTGSAGELYVKQDNGSSTNWILTSTGSYTDEQAQDAIGAMIADTATIDLTYTDATPELKADVIDNSITDAKLRQSSALSVVGRSVNSTGNVADISAGTDKEIFRRSGVTVGFGSIDLSSSAAVGSSVLANANTTATSSNTNSTIVARDGSGNFSAGTITAALIGNASTATALQTPRNINGIAFDGTANITVTAAAGTLTGTTLSATVVSSSLTSVGTLSTGVWNATVIAGTYGGTGVNNGPNTITLAGNLATSGANSLTLTTTGTTNVTLPTTGTLVNTAVATLSSLTSIGTINTGTWQATKIGLAYGGTNADLSATGGAGKYLKQNSSGATITVTAVAESELTFTDITTNNVSTSAHGFAPKLPNDATKFLDGTGSYSVPPGTGITRGQAIAPMMGAF